MSRLLTTPTQMGALSLQNRVVMAPMTRSRSPGNVPGPLVAEYYGQRASVGLVITEGTSPSPNGLGYPRIPGIYSAEQREGWRAITSAIHAGGAKVFVQLMHTGRVGHPHNLPAGAELVSPSATTTGETMYTDAAGPQPNPVARAMDAADLERARAEFVHAARTAIEAGADGIELHAANGYLLEQFLSPQTNQRTDVYGGSIENRIRFVVEIAAATAAAIGAERVGIRLSPHGSNAGMKPYDGVDETYRALVRALAPLGLAYLHLADHSSMGAPAIPPELRAAIRAAWPRTLILAGGFDAEKAEAALAAGEADLVAFARPIISNPDFVARVKDGLPLAATDFATLYTPGPEGYTDYPRAG